MHSEETEFYLALVTGILILGIVISIYLVTISRYKKRGVQAYLDAVRRDFDLLERERQRIAHDLHDEIGAKLAAIRLLLGEEEEGKEVTATDLGNIRKITIALQQSARSITRNLIPHTWQREGLQVALREIESVFRRSHHFSVTTHWKIQNRLSGEAELHFYRIILEILGNTIRHAHASKVEITLQQSRKKIMLYVRDNGIGFSVSPEREKEEGVGIRSIRNRVALLEGSLHLYSEKGKGVIYQIEIPSTHLLPENDTDHS